MQELIKRKAYAPDVVSGIESMGATAVSIANRWMLGWPDRVNAMLGAGIYLECLKSQSEQESDILANEMNLRHMSRREVLELYEIRECPLVMVE